MHTRLGRLLAVVSAVLALATVFLPRAGATSPSTKASGSLAVAVVASAWPGLDPATDPSDPDDVDYLNAIYGQLFELGRGNTIVPDEASGYTFSNHNSTVTITIRAGVRFSNGDPFTAADVAWSINRDLEAQYGNTADANFPLAGPATANGNKVVINLSQPDTALIAAFIGEAPNYTVDENVLNGEGEDAFSQLPIGAGPFKVVSNLASVSLVLAKNPDYWQRGRPLLSRLTFTNVDSDSTALSDLESGADQMTTGMTTIGLLNQASKSGMTVTRLPQAEDEFIALNTELPPFNNPLAREALAYATNTRQLVSELYGNAYTPVEAETGPGQEFYVRTDRHFHAYNLTKARALIHQLGGLTVSLSTTSNTSYWINEVQAIASMWEAAGISVNILDYSLPQMLNITLTNTWQAIDENWGPSFDPAINDSEYFRSHEPLSGVNDPKLDGLLNQAEGFVAPSSEARVFHQIDDDENEQAYAVWLYAKNAFVVTTKAVQANSGIAHDLLQVRWQDLSVK